jgi:hypothetical protein
MNDEIEMPRLKNKNTTRELLIQNLIDLQKELLKTIEENRKYKQLVSSNNEYIESLNKRINQIDSMIVK